MIDELHLHVGVTEQLNCEPQLYRLPKLPQGLLRYNKDFDLLFEQSFLLMSADCWDRGGVCVFIKLCITWPFLMMIEASHDPDRLITIRSDTLS